MNKHRLKIVLDTNIFLVALASNHSYSWIYDALIEEQFDLCISNEVITEYEEIIASRYGIQSTSSILEGLTLLPNVHLIDPHYNWNLLKDPDDNKFVDCAIAAAADFIVSNDSDFNNLKNITFPPVTVLKYTDFEKKYKALFIKLS